MLHALPRMQGSALGAQSLSRYPLATARALRRAVANGRGREVTAAVHANDSAALAALLDSELQCARRSLPRRPVFRESASDSIRKVSSMKVQADALRALALESELPAGDLRKGLRASLHALFEPAREALGAITDLADRHFSSCGRAGHVKALLQNRMGMEVIPVESASEWGFEGGSAFALRFPYLQYFQLHEPWFPEDGIDLASLSGACAVGQRLDCVPYFTPLEFLHEAVLCDGSNPLMEEVADAVDTAVARYGLDNFYDLDWVENAGALDDDLEALTYYPPDIASELAILRHGGDHFHSRLRAIGATDYADHKVRQQAIQETPKAFRDRLTALDGFLDEVDALAGDTPPDAAGHVFGWGGFLGALALPDLMGFFVNQVYHLPAMESCDGCGAAPDRLNAEVVRYYTVKLARFYAAAAALDASECG